MNQYLIRAALVSVALVATPAAAAPKETYVATLSGGQLVPVVTTMASGSAILRLNDKKLEVSVSFDDLSSPLAAAHIHCCAIAGANAGVAIDFDPDPMTSGTFKLKFDLDDAQTYTSGFLSSRGGLASASTQFLEAFRSERAYIVLHTQQFPAGELRGQILPQAGAVPEPATWAMLISGFGLVGSTLRRRKLAAVTA
jgi:hypothetical protein